MLNSSRYLHERSFQVELAEEASDIIKLNNALTMEEKAKLYEAIGYQEGAEEGILEYPRK